MTRTAFILLVFTVACEFSFADEPSTQDSGLRVLSWNISSNGFVRQPDDFQALLRWADADIVMLDEVRPVADAGKLQTVLSGLQTEQESVWNIDYGISGGRQRGVIASRLPLESLPEFSEFIPYPEAAMAYILAAMSAHERADSELSMDFGIPVNGAVVLAGDRRLLVVVADLQCCGKDRASWQEYRRRVESREIRRVISEVLNRTEVDAVILAGDFNLVNSPFPLALLAGPYPHPHPGLIAAEIYHRDGSTAWTWDGRGTPFPSGTLDYQLYGPHSLHVRKGIILDTEDLDPEHLDRYGLEAEASRRLSRHRPLLVEYGWN
jgi:endonuclease/exonuclease/phosphatase family metal-dependent hydrolase